MLEGGGLILFVFNQLVSKNLSLVHKGAVNICMLFNTCKCNNCNDTLTISRSALCTVCVSLKSFRIMFTIM